MSDGLFHTRIKEEAYSESWQTEKMTVLKSVILVDHVEKIVEEANHDFPIFTKEDLEWFKRKVWEETAEHKLPKKIAQYIEAHKRWFGQQNK